MKNNKELQLMWKITKLINKTHCNNKLIIHRIIIKKSKEYSGCYKHIHKTNKNYIEICPDECIFEKINTLSHELAHAYIHQINKSEDHVETANFLKNKFLHKRARKHIANVISHNKLFDKINKMFYETIEENFEIKPKK